jgi:hypothetical protein
MHAQGRLPIGGEECNEHVIYRKVFGTATSAYRET